MNNPPTIGAYETTLNLNIDIYKAAVFQSSYIRLKDAQGNQIELANGRISISSIANITINAPSVVINGRPVAPSPSPI